MKVFGTDYPTRDGTCIRDCIHMYDLADAHLRALHYLEQENPSDFFNLGNTLGTSVLEVIEATKKVTGCLFKIESSDRRPGDPAELVGDSAKAQKILGWVPQYPEIETIVVHAWNWYCKCGKIGENCKMNIVYASNDRFAQILGISLLSLFENNKDMELTVYILDDKITKENRQKLLSIGNKYNRSLNFVAIPDLNKLAGQKIDVQRWSLAAFSRLYLPSLLPDVKRALYIDCDTLVLGDLSDLERLQLPEKDNCAAVVECIGNKHKKNVGLEAQDNYINSGVMLIDLDRWREQKIEQCFSLYIQEMQGLVPYVDQGVINHVLKDQIYILPPEYNVTTVCYDFKYEELPRYRKTKYLYSKSSFEQAKTHPVVVHFTTSFLSRRPWIRSKQTHPFAQKWRKYKEISPWADMPFWPDNRGKIKKIYEKFFHMLPRLAAVELSGFLHSDAKALIERKK